MRLRHDLVMNNQMFGKLLPGCIHNIMIIEKKEICLKKSVIFKRYYCHNNHFRVLLCSTHSESSGQR